MGHVHLGAADDHHAGRGPRRAGQPCHGLGPLCCKEEPEKKKKSDKKQRFSFGELGNVLEGVSEGYGMMQEVI